MCPGRVAGPSQKHNIAFYRTWTLPLLKDTPCPIGEQKMRLVVSAPWTTRTGVGAGRFGCLGATSSRRPSIALVGRVPSFEWAAYLRRIRSPSVRSPVLLPNGMERFIVAACHSNFFAGGSSRLWALLWVLHSRRPLFIHSARPFLRLAAGSSVPCLGSVGWAPNPIYSP